MNRIYIILVMLLCAMAGNAQFRYGIRLGGEISTAVLGGVSNFNLKHGSGFAGGLTCEYMTRESGGLAFGGSLLYSHGAAMEAVGGPGSKDIRKLGNDFLEIPLRAEYKYFLPSTNGILGGFIYTGPAFRWRLDKDASDVEAASRRFQPGWDIGLGLDIINFLQVSAGYRFGIGNALRSEMAKLRADGVQVSVALLFDI